MAKKQKGNYVDSVIDIIEEKNCSASQAAREVGISHSTFFNNLKSSSVEQKNRYARATELRAEAIFEEILDIADHTEDDMEIQEIAEGVYTKKVDHEHIQRSKLKIDARKWMLSKMMPTKYGDKIDVTTDGDKMPSPQIILNKNE